MCALKKCSKKRDVKFFLFVNNIWNQNTVLDFNVLINVLTNEFNLFEDYIMADCFDGKPNILITNKSDRGLSYDRYVPRIIILWTSRREKVMWWYALLTKKQNFRRTECSHSDP